MLETPKGAWLQVSGRAPSHFKTKGAAMDELKSIVNHALEAGWRKAHGAATRGFVQLEKEGREPRMVFVELVDADGFKLEGKERTGKRMSTGRWKAIQAGTFITPAGRSEG